MFSCVHFNTEGTVDAMTNLGCLGLLIWLLPAFTVLALETGVEEISKFEKFSETQANISLWLSAAAYCPKDTYRTRDFLGPTEGFIVHSDFEYEEFDLQGYTGYLHSDRSIYVVFRGSHDTRNWIVNLNAFKTNYTLYPECQCEVHEGFYNALAKVSDRLIKDVLQAQERHPLYQVKVTGHSLGAALAQLFAMNLNKIGISASVYNFGQPRVGDPNYALFAYQKLPLYFRVTHNRDTVPHVRMQTYSMPSISYFMLLFPISDVLFLFYSIPLHSYPSHSRWRFTTPAMRSSRMRRALCEHVDCPART